MKPKWTQHDLEMALEAVANGMAKREAATTHNIPWGTFACKLTGRRKIDTSTPKTYHLTPQEEADIAKFIKDSSELGFGLTKPELLLTVKNMLDVNGRETKWPNNMPSGKWYRLFKKRHTQIVLRTPQKLGKQRTFVTKPIILKWFKDFQATVSSLDPTILLDSSRIYNCDESGFSLDAASGRVLSFAGTKFVYRVGSELKTMITVLVCASASGHFTKPMLIYPGTQFRGFKPQEIFEESFVTKSKNGWTNQTIFYEWLQQVFHPETAHVNRPVLLLVDGHISHQSIESATFCRDNGIILYCLPPHASHLESATFCRDNGIILYCLPPHASHLMQPLDVGVFKTMKAEWKKSVKKQNETEIITKRTFALAFKETYENTMKRTLAPQAFRTSGLFPLDPNNIHWEKLLPANAVDAVSLSSLPAPNSSIPLPAPNPSIPLPEPNSSIALPAPNSSIPLPAPNSSIPLPAPNSSIPLPAPNSSIPLHAPTSAIPLHAPTSSSMSIPEQSAASTSEGISDFSANLQKYSILCAQIGESTLHQYFTRLEEGYDIPDRLFSLWKEYHNCIMTQSASATLSPMIPPSPDHLPAKLKNPLALPTIKRGLVKRRKVPQLPSLVSGDQFIDYLVNKERTQKEEMERKQARKLSMQMKKQEKAKESEEKKKKQEEQTKLRQERKKEKEDEIQRRKENKKRQMEEKKSQKDNIRNKKRKVARKVVEDVGDTTSEDESQMVLDDTSDVDWSDGDFNLLLDDTFEVEKAITESESQDTIESQQNPTSNDTDRSLWDVFPVPKQNQ